MNCSVVSASDTLLRAVVPATITSLENDIRVDVTGSSSNILTKKLKLLKPILRDYQPRKVYWGDTLVIKGRKLKYASIMNNKVQLGDLVCPVTFIYSDSSIAVRIPNTMETIYNPLKLTINGFLLSGTEPVELLPPYFDFTPKEGLHGTIVTLEGRFNTTSARNQVFFGITPATINSVTATKMMIILLTPYFLL